MAGGGFGAAIARGVARVVCGAHGVIRAEPPEMSVLTSSEGCVVEKIEGPTLERQVVRRWTRDHSAHGEAVPLDLVA
jgi:hypothetical protein